MTHSDNLSKKFRSGSLQRKARRQSKENAVFDRETEAMIAEILSSRHEQQRPKKTESKR